MTPTCPDCQQEMALVKKMKTTKMYMARRYHCELCNTFETVFGDGQRSDAVVRDAVRVARNVGNENE